MTTLQEHFESDYPDKSVEVISADIERYLNSNFTNRNLDLRKYGGLKRLFLVRSKLTSIDLSQNKELKDLNLSTSNLTSVEFLNTMPNPEKLEKLTVSSNNIQPTDIKFFSKFINLEYLKLGTMEGDLNQGKHNKFHGSFKAWKNLTKLENICIEATDINEGLEYLPMSLAQSTRGGKYFSIECSPHNTNAKCKIIQDQLRPFNYDLEAWHLANLITAIGVLFCVFRKRTIQGKRLLVLWIIAFVIVFLVVFDLAVK